MQAFIKKVLQADSFVLFSKSYCPYSKKAKAILQENKIAFVCFELDEKQPLGQSKYSSAEILQGLAEYSKIQTVPQLFKNGRFLGDSSQIAQHFKR
jgi:glutaredoxin 3